MTTLTAQHHFKSVDPAVIDTTTIEDYLWEPLDFQYMFDRRTTPWEIQQWDHDELQSFKIDVGKIDRLYHIHTTDINESDREYELIARLQYKGQPLYVELNASCDFTGFDCQGGGAIFVSRNASLFMRLVLTSGNKKDLIYESLAEDGIEVEEQSEFDACQRIFRKNVPMLKYLCHEAFYKNEEELQPYVSLLPTILSNSVDEFIQFHKAKEAYDNNW